jgi:hypothetical protein
MLRTQSEFGPNPFATTTSGALLPVLDNFQHGTTSKPRESACMRQQQQALSKQPSKARTVNVYWIRPSREFHKERYLELRW